MNKTKMALLHSVIALLLCFSMLVGTTFAWFTDEVSSGKNQIVAGNLDIELYWTATPNDPDSWKQVNAQTNIFKENTLWEPGHTEVVYLKIVNEGSLALKYQLGINVAGETGSVNKDGREFKLSEFIKFGIVDGANEYTREQAIDAAEAKGVTALNQPYNSGTQELPAKSKTDANNTDHEQIVTLVVYMPTSVGNEANYGKDAPIPTINLGIRLQATQLTSEDDSFGSDYDADATYPPSKINVSAETAVPAEKMQTTADPNVVQLIDAVSVGQEDGVRAEAPADVLLPAGEPLKMEVETKEESEAVITLDEGERVTPLDIHVNVAEGNQTPIIITLPGILPKGLNQGNVKLYHVEDGNTVQMTEVATLAEVDAHNEFYYNAATGDVVMALKSFSEVAVVANEENPWDGTSATAFSGGTGTEAEPYIIANASQLAYFRDIVDGKDVPLPALKQGEAVFDRTFAGQYVKLAADIVLNAEDGTEVRQFDPIGWGYAYSGHNRDNTAGKVFMGTFDGQGHVIMGLYQNGWDLENTTKTDYTYTNCGMGLFASVQDATIKNLTIKHANIVAECVEMGIVAGLAQGNCTFENIYIYKSSIANYQRATGGVVGEVSPKLDASGNVIVNEKIEDGKDITNLHTFKNVHVGSTCTVGSLWGDFDCPVGGVVGAYWDDTENTRIVMDAVGVSCVLDVYNDVTSAYQWYAYRRAGMLIGNTDRTRTVDGRTVADAPYLNCDGCIVVYDDWRNYTYCEFTNEQNPGRNYPWVRVEPGLNNPSYSNPRYGHPVDAANNKVTDDIHEHMLGDECMTLIQFNQLYGGGQGVYGQSTHEGVKEGKFTITFIGGDGHIEDVWYVTGDEMANGNKTIKDLADNNIDNKHVIPATTNGTKKLLAWEDANGTKYMTFNDNGTAKEYPTAIKEGNLVDIVLYPEWSDEYNVYFLDHNNKVLYYEVFEKTNNSKKLSAESLAAIEVQRKAIQNELDNTENVIKVTWDQDPASIDFNGKNDDIAVKIKLNLSTTSITLTPHYDDQTGVLTHYTVSDVNASDTNKSIHIPSSVGHVPVTGVDKDAFDGFDNLTAVRVPVTMTRFSKGMFPGKLGWLGIGDDRQTVTIYYEGTYEQWQQITKDDGWDDTLGDGSRVFFLKKVNGREVVDYSQNIDYIELYKYRSGLSNVFEWVPHNHAYVRNAPDGCKGHYKNFTDYDAEGRPDRNYWFDDQNRPIVDEDGNPITYAATTP